ncbi:hypothetical protein TMatcc_003050 [Talaromyces marneffei ATCC 18224]|uniref:Large ribosomal subunit protein mL67 n=2 Tax=Talaromyces marneffei TaxID=37727 RepID=B6Q6C8_TALMQ|nr:uncharacterized protein EYB26_001884 [Talaromyces marneffei]EEA28603.1 conserved hypothetical protein [Talaromyces marneffei ATCC 18224]KAE8555774.1 hypothetical protein EYB25_000472 [Talaromyces marneffei]QGA14231.1 hypothetical protein EYB26_001884 [Talaromyces marneffei]
MGSRLPQKRIAKFFDELTKRDKLDKYKLEGSALDPTKIATWELVRRPPVPTDTVIQGKPRHPYSKAYREFQRQEGARLRKALNRITHGKNIFVYNNIRTNQVVYSLTRYLEEKSVLSQLVYHGKKTIPASLRKDMWAPYYSVHFDDAKVGLRAYHLLREFSLQRQLAPPKEMVTMTEKWLDQKRPRDLLAAKKFDEEHEKQVGKLLPKKERARILMDQKATSVADIAAVLAIQEEEIKNGFGAEHRKELGRRALQRIRMTRKAERTTAFEAAQRVEEFEGQVQSQVPLEIEDEFDKVPSNSEYAVKPEQVKILWNDIHDAHYASSWPDRVHHGLLEKTSDHVMPGQMQVVSEEDAEDILAHDDFAEAAEAPSVLKQ